MTTAHEILQAAQKHMEGRAITYDKPEGERSMPATVAAFNAVTGSSMTEEQGWLFMAVLKAVRSQQGGYRADSYEDGAAYFALAGEAAYVDRLPMDDVLKELREALGGDDLDEGDPWIKWGGEDWEGPIGLHGDTMVNVLFRGEGESGELMDVDMIKELYWGLDGDDTDIIAYRIVK